MLKLLQILLLWGLYININVFPNLKLDNFKISIPEFIPGGKPFEAILTTSKAFEDANELDIYIITGSDLFLNEAQLWTKRGKNTT